MGRFGGAALCCGDFLGCANHSGRCGVGRDYLGRSHRRAGGGDAADQARAGNFKRTLFAANLEDGSVRGRHGVSILQNSTDKRTALVLSCLRRGEALVP
jgi:hypothetical protein